MRRERLIALLVTLAVVIPAATAVAADPTPNATMYEVIEDATFQGNTRSAVADLAGTVNGGTPICAAAIFTDTTNDTCTIYAVASDSINLATGTGPASGTFTLTIQDANTTDGPEVVVLVGTLRGMVDLSPAVLQGIPLGSISGTWTASGVPNGPMAGVSASGTFTGIFRLPFGTQAQAYYLVDDQPVLVQPNERSLGTPTVRLELVFQSS